MIHKRKRSSRSAGVGPSPKHILSFWHRGRCWAQVVSKGAIVAVIEGQREYGLRRLEYVSWNVMETVETVVETVVKTVETVETVHLWEEKLQCINFL